MRYLAIRDWRQLIVKTWGHIFFRMGLRWPDSLYLRLAKRESRKWDNCIWIWELFGLIFMKQWFSPASTLRKIPFIPLISCETLAPVLSWWIWDFRKNFCCISWTPTSTHLHTSTGFMFCGALTWGDFNCYPVPKFFGCLSQMLLPTLVSQHLASMLALGIRTLVF